MLRVRAPIILFVFASCLAIAPVLGEASVIQYLNFSVKGEHDIYIRDLKIDEIELALDDQPVEVKYLGYRDVETAFAVILENSPRTAPHNVSVPQWGLINPIDQVRYNMLYDFFGLLTEIGSVSLSEFFREVTILQDFTRHDDLLVNAIQRMELNSIGIVLDQIEVGRALGWGVDLLRDRPEKRKVLLVVTKTIDRLSYRNLEEYQQMLMDTDIDVYIISFAARAPSGVNSTFEEKMNRYFFRQLVGETGGHAYITGEYAYVEELFTDLKGRITNLYTIGFYVDPGKEVREHEVKLRVLRNKSRVWHRRALRY